MREVGLINLKVVYQDLEVELERILQASCLDQEDAKDSLLIQGRFNKEKSRYEKPLERKQDSFLFSNIYGC